MLDQQEARAAAVSAQSQEVSIDLHRIQMYTMQGANYTLCLAGVKPNVRTFTALITALGNDKQWDRALTTIRSMKASSAWQSSVEPNAYTYSALLKAMGEKVDTYPFFPLNCLHMVE